MLTYLDLLVWNVLYVTSLLSGAERKDAKTRYAKVYGAILPGLSDVGAYFRDDSPWVKTPYLTVRFKDQLRKLVANNYGTGCALAGPHYTIGAPPTALVTNNDEYCIQGISPIVHRLLKALDTCLVETNDASFAVTKFQAALESQLSFFRPLSFLNGDHSKGFGLALKAADPSIDLCYIESACLQCLPIIKGQGSYHTAKTT